MEIQETEKTKKAIFLCNYPNCSPKQENWYFDGYPKYGRDSSSAVEKHIVNTHLAASNPILKGKTVAEVKKIGLENEIKNSMLKVSPNDPRVFAMYTTT